MLWVSRSDSQEKKNFFQHYITYNIFKALPDRNSFGLVCVCVMTKEKKKFILSKFSTYEVIENSHSFKHLYCIPNLFQAVWFSDNSIMSCKIYFVKWYFVMVKFLEKLTGMNFFQKRILYIKKSRNWTSALMNFMTKNHGEHFAYLHKK